MSGFAIEDRPDPTDALETAIWCNRCMLPSGVRWPWPDNKKTPSFIACEDCDGWLDEDGNVIANL